MPATAEWPCLSLRGEVLWLAVSVSPSARRTQTDGLHDGALRVRLARGAMSRRKWLAVDAPRNTLAQWLQAQLGGPAQATRDAV